MLTPYEAVFTLGTNLLSEVRASPEPTVHSLDLLSLPLWCLKRLTVVAGISSPLPVTQLDDGHDGKCLSATLDVDCVLPKPGQQPERYS